jgi:hypothetical protein
VWEYVLYDNIEKPAAINGSPNLRVGGADIIKMDFICNIT